MNASLGYTFINNSIEEYTFMDPQQSGVSVTTYDNIGKKQQTGLFLFLNWNPIPLVRVYMNAGLDYTHLKSTWGNMSNNGFSGRAFGGIESKFVNGWRVNLTYGHISPGIELQGKRSAFSMSNIIVSKDLWIKN